MEWQIGDTFSIRITQRSGLVVSRVQRDLPYTKGSKLFWRETDGIEDWCWSGWAIKDNNSGSTEGRAVLAEANPIPLRASDGQGFARKPRAGGVESATLTFHYAPRTHAVDASRAVSVTHESGIALFLSPVNGAI